MPERATMSMSDEDVLALLASSFAVPNLEPTYESLRDVRMLAARKQSGDLRPRRARVVVTWRRRFAVVGVMVATAVVGTGTAFAAGAPVPEPLRALAVEVGLPVTPPAVVNVQNDTSTLQSDLASKSPHSDTSTVHAAQALAGALGKLDAPDRAQVEPQSHRVLQAACHALLGGPATLHPSLWKPVDGSDLPHVCNHISPSVPTVTPGSFPTGRTPGTGETGNGGGPGRGDSPSTGNSVPGTVVGGHAGPGTGSGGQRPTSQHRGPPSYGGSGSWSDGGPGSAPSGGGLGTDPGSYRPDGRSEGQGSGY
jgi:hypothetical protein